MSLRKRWIGSGEKQKKPPPPKRWRRSLSCKTLFQAHLLVGFISLPPRVCLAQTGGEFNGTWVTIVLSHDGHFHVVELERLVIRASWIALNT
jgi:hypothetical protein